MNQNGATASTTTSGSAPLAARILLVEDDLAFGEATAKLLRNAGFEVFLAPDHRLALEDIESKRAIDLMITDIVMPQRVNGLALARMARLRRPHLKVLYLTAYEIPSADREALGTILRKPIENEHFLAEVKRALAAD